MKNINEANVFEVVKLEVNNESMYLSEGMEVIVWTDETDFEKEYAGEITFVNTDGIEIENQEIIPWEYIKVIEIQNS